MNILITGASGFIGSALTERLRQSHYCLADIKTGQDINFIEKINYVADVVVHLAAETSVFNTDHKKIVKANISGFMEVVEYCNRYKAKLIFASSSSANNITSLYGLSKKFDEDYAKIYSDNFIGLRFHNVYGKNPREDTLLGRLMYQEPNEEMIVYNNGQNIRHFTYLKDVIDTIVNLTTNDQAELKNTVVNVYNKEKTTVLDFIKNVELYKKVKYRLTSEVRLFDKVEQIVNIELTELTNSFLSIEDGLKETFN